MKKKIFWIALVVLSMVKVSSYGQNQNPPITTEGNHVVKYGTVGNAEIVKIVVERANPTNVKVGFGWSTNYWGSPPLGHPEQGSTGAFITASLPGSYTNTSQTANGVITVSYISDPWVGVDQAATTGSSHLTSFGGKITANSFVSFKISSYLAPPSSNNRFYKDGQEIDRDKDVFTAQSSGNYTIRTTDGKNGAVDISTQVVISSTTPTVTSVSVSPSSASVGKGQTQSFSATVSGTNNPGQGVTWNVSGGSASSINASGMLTVGANETATSLVVRATSTVDPSKSGTANVTITASSPTVTSVVVNPSSASVGKGQTQSFSATVSGTNNPGQGVIWSVSGGSASTINASGVLSVGASETATSLVVRATSTVDPSKSGTATVTVTTTQPTQYTITLSANPPQGGGVSGAGTFNAGTTQTVVATPSSGWRFVSWTEGGSQVSTNASYAFPLNSNRNLVANFEQTTQAKYRVVFSVNLPDATITLGDRTNAAGNYIFDDVLPGTYTYSAARSGYQTATGSVAVVNQQAVVNISLQVSSEPTPKSPVFKDLQGEYAAGSAPVTLKVIGEGMSGITFTYTVNGTVTTTFAPAAKGTYHIEAVSSDGAIRIWRNVVVK